MPRAKAGELKAKWANEGEAAGGDIAYACGVGCHKADLHLLHYVIGAGHWNPNDRKTDPSFLDELKARGYDLTTIRFSIQKLPPPATPEPARD